MEPRSGDEDAAARLRREYAQLKRDIVENDERVDAARRENAGRLKQLNELLRKRGLLADQVCRFARHFAECDEAPALEMESLRRLCRSNAQHIRGLTSAIADLQDEVACPAAAAEQPVRRGGASGAGHEASPAAAVGDEQRAPSRGHGERLRPKTEFIEFLDRMDGDEATRRWARHSEGDLGPEKRCLREARSPTTAAGTAPGTRCPSGSRLRNSSRRSAALSWLVYALAALAVMSAARLWRPAGNWYRVLGEYWRRTPVESPPQPAAPLTIPQRVRRWCVVAR